MPSTSSVEKKVPTMWAGILALAILALLVGGLYLDSHFVVNNPSWPQPQTGRVYPRSYDHGNYVCYLSRSEIRAESALFVAGFVIISGFIVTIAFFRHKLYRREDDA